MEDIGGGGTKLDKTLAARRRKTNKARPKEDIIEHGSDLVINEDNSEPVMSLEPASDSQITQSGIVAQEPSSPLNSNLHGPSTSGIGRSLRNNFDCWEKLSNSSFACDIISRGVRLPFSNKLKAQRLLKKFDKVRFYSHNKRKTLEEECDRLLDLGVIEEIPRTSFYFSNHIFYKIKPDGTIRLIFDMKLLNTLIKKPSFSMLKSNKIFPYFHLNSWACKLDLKDAYWHVPLHNSAQKFLTSKLGKRKFKWKVMPFGLKTAPYIFSKLMNTVIKHIRSKYNILIFNYLDDILILANNPITCKTQIKTVIKILNNLGWNISFKKSIIEPVQQIEFLGVHYDLSKKTMKPAQKNIDKCIKLSRAFSEFNKADLKLYQMLIGSLNFSSYFTFFGRFHLKFLHKFHQYFSSGFKPIPPSFKVQLNPWTLTNMYDCINIPKKHTQVELFTDASNQGWGAALIESKGIHTTSDTWSQSD